MSPATKVARCYRMIRTAWSSTDRCILAWHHTGPCQPPTAPAPAKAHDPVYRAAPGADWRNQAPQRPALAQEHSPSSKSAAAKAEGFRTEQQRTIWLILSRTDRIGLTTEEICIITGWDGSTVRPRLVELDGQGRAGRVTKNGRPYHPVTNREVVTRNNARGNAMALWRAIK